MTSEFSPEQYIAMTIVGAADMVVKAFVSKMFDDTRQTLHMSELLREATRIADAEAETAKTPHGGGMMDALTTHLAEAAKLAEHSEYVYSWQPRTPR